MPRPNRRAQSALAALLALGVTAGCTGGSDPSPGPTPTGDTVRVPDLVGSTVREAALALGSHRLWIDVPRAEVDDRRAGTVAAQHPAAGALVDSHTVVHLVLSAGPHPEQSTVSVAGCDLTLDATEATDRPCIGGVKLVPIEPPTAAEICDRALGGRDLSAKATTLQAVRRTNIGGPPPGLTPGRDAFPGLPGDTPAAWCWTAAASPSPGEEGSTWELYVAVPDGRSVSFFAMGGTQEPPPGPPSIP